MAFLRSFKGSRAVSRGIRISVVIVQKPNEASNEAFKKLTFLPFRLTLFCEFLPDT